MSVRTCRCVVWCWSVVLTAALSACSMASERPSIAPGPLLVVRPFVPLTPSEAGKTFASARADRVAVLADRHVYYADELHGQFYALFLGRVKPEDAEQRAIVLTLRDAGGTVLAQERVTPVVTPKLPVLVRTLDLIPGKYELHAALMDPSGQTLEQASRSFDRSDRTDPRPEFPDGGIPIIAHNLDVARDATWPISTGVAIPKMTLIDTAGLVLLENGKPIPAQFTVRGTWSPDGCIKWLGVDFLARYDKGKARSYRLVRCGRAPDASPQLSVVESEAQIVIDTGTARFVIGRRPFTGVERAWIDRNGDGQYADDELVIDGAGGAYVADQDGTRFTSALDTEAQVIVEESGPLSATIAAKGWCTSEAGDTLCKYVVRLRAFAGEQGLQVSHRIINTIPDQYVDTRLSNAGFAVVAAARASAIRAGVDDAALAHDLSARPRSVFLHQERADRARLVAEDAELHTGRRADGAFYVATPHGVIATHLRDMYQRFPHEIELDASGDADVLMVHLWPRHGRIVFTEEEELARDQVYKVRWAHQGRLLELKIPDKYHKVLEELEKTEPWAGADAQLMIVNAQKNLTKMQAASGMGTVLGAEFELRLEPAMPKDEAVLARAALVQQSPHAMADPRWTCATGALGAIAPRDPEKFGPAERLMDSAYNFYRRAIIDGGDEYGKWIYGGVHSQWAAEKNAANMKRVWQMSHYQNVFQAWLLYYRSGLRDHYDWARIHTAQHLDVGVNNYLRYPPGTHSYSHFGELGGNIYHCKGFMPWAGNSSTGGHWIDITCYFMPWFLTGDRRGLDIAELWMTTIGKMGTSNELDLPDDCDGYQHPDKVAEIDAYLKEHPELKKEDYPQWIKDELAKPRPFNPREVFVPLGEFVQYYQATWDPQAIIHLDRYAEYLSPPFECTSSPGLASFGKHWQDWYYNLTRDPRVVERVKQFLDSDYQLYQPPRYDSFSAFLYHVTGDDSYLRHVVADVYDATLLVHDAPGERYHEYSLAYSNPAAMLIGRLPFVLHAIDQAGLAFEHPIGAPTALPTRGGRVDQADKWLVPPRGWSNAGLTILGVTSKPTQVAVRIDGVRGWASLRGGYKLYHGFPVLDALKLDANLREAYAAQREQAVTFDAPTRFNDPPELRNFGAGARVNPMRFPYVERASNDPQVREYRLEVGGEPIDLPVLHESPSEAGPGTPMPEVAVIARTMFFNAKVQETPFRVIGTVKAFMRPLDPSDVVNLTLEAVSVKYHMPTRFKLTDAQGKVITDTSVFMFTSRNKVELTLDPTEHPLPWLFECSSGGDNRFTFTGADELLFARLPEHFDAVIPRLERAVEAGASETSNPPAP